MDDPRGRRADHQRGAGHRRSGCTFRRTGGDRPASADRRRKKAKILPLLTDLVNGSQKPGSDNLAKASGGSMQLTRGVVEALRDDPDVAVPPNG